MYIISEDMHHSASLLSTNSKNSVHEGEWMEEEELSEGPSSLYNRSVNGVTRGGNKEHHDHHSPFHYYKVSCHA